MSDPARKVRVTAPDGNLDLTRTIKRLTVPESSLRAETREQHEILQQFGCDELQGFYTSAPVSSRKFVCLVKKHNKVNQLPLI